MGRFDTIKYDVLITIDSNGTALFSFGEQQ
jgi:hypothetical protein